MKSSRKLVRLRHQVDRIDRQILHLLGRRGRAVQQIGKAKAASGRTFRAPERESQILARLKKENRGPYSFEAISGIFREVMSASLALEAQVNVAYLGPPASFTHLAAIKCFGRQPTFNPTGGIDQVFDEVEKGRSDFGVVPVENSTEGVVTHTLDCFLESSLKIQGEILLDISQNLLTVTGKLSNIRRLYSHPHATAQCRGWLDKNLRGVPVIDVESTSAAAKAAAKDPESAAIASEYAAELYHLKVVRKKIEDQAHNKTRFLIVGREIPKRSGHDKTSLVFSVKDQVGVLFRMLKPFAEAGINLTKIESRPFVKWRPSTLRQGSGQAGRTGSSWEYIFFVDIEGHVARAPIAKAIRQLEKNCHFLKVLGSYPRAR